ncbi:PREDICTED: regulatory protein NPR2-like isoform X1 [Camelina sativa]|uniref:Regulatory protein NPR2-like isoform X1 n=1 Tax=Camelina sativa TaxID=90675 RepID=A0ABM0TZ81_CAMSA|nr:PREDICTED: regulatory protein NPR2-like isoform X1 [Camelina sativa]
MMATTNTVRFSDSYEISNTSGNSSFFAAESSIDYRSEFLTSSEVAAFQLLSNCLESVFDSPETFYTDAKLVLSGGREVSFHRCILSARVPVFKSALATAAATKNQRSTAVMKIELKEIAKDYEVGFDSVMAVLAYVYSGRVRPPPRGASDCVDDDCYHVACRPVVDFMVEVLYLAFVFQIPELMTLYERQFLDIVDKIVVEDILVILKLDTLCGKAYMKLLDRCIKIIAKSDMEFVSLDKSLPQHIVKQITYIRKEFFLEPPELKKHVKNIYKALDSDDVELVKMLLTEGYTNLDESYALHFAVAHCDVKTAYDLINLELADVNHRNPRGYTVLHVAAIRKEPKLIVSLLTKGANALDTTFDGRTALVIAKRLTKADDYNTTTEQGKPSLKGGLCIEVLEHAQKLEYKLPREASPSLPVTPEELKMRLLYYENRVALAKILFPVEAVIVMEIVKLDETSEFTASSLEPADPKRTSLDLNMAPFIIQEKHLSRLRALCDTVDLGKRYFPRCSLDHFMDTEDLNYLASVEEDTPEKRLQKKQRYMELQETLMKTFSEGKEEFGKSSTSKPTSALRSNSKLSHRRLRVDRRDFVKQPCGNGSSGMKNHVTFPSSN